MVAVPLALVLTHLSVASCWALGQPTSLRAHHARLPSATMSMGDPAGALTLLGGALAKSDAAENNDGAPAAAPFLRRILLFSYYTEGCVEGCVGG